MRFTFKIQVIVKITGFHHQYGGIYLILITRFVMFQEHQFIRSFQRHLMPLTISISFGYYLNIISTSKIILPPPE